jgi:TolB-like protein/DNA-binding winged helix-turn-helix (wHTH) protein
MRFLFGDCILDPARCELSRGGKAIHVEPQVMDVLLHLIRNREQVVSKDNLLAAVWGGRIVSESTLNNRINAARRAVGDSGARQNFIRTVARRGFRFVGDVRQEPIESKSNGECIVPVPGARTRMQANGVEGGLDKPSIAVLPFANLGNDPEQEYFADGMSEEIITALSRIRWLFVIARNSSFIYKGRNVDVKQVGEELGVRYVLEGSVRRAGERLRIASKLVDATTGASLWAERYDGDLADVFALQDCVAASVAGAIEPTLEAAEIRRSSERPTGDLSAYDLYLRALPHIVSWDKDRIFQAMGLLDEAIRRDGKFGLALAYAACCRVQLKNNAWSPNAEQNRQEGIELARRALQADPDNPIVLANAALALGFFLEDLGSCIALIERALTLNPSFALGWQWSGFLRLLNGELDIAIEHFERSMRLSPTRDRWNSSCLLGIGIARFFGRQFDKAAAILLRSRDELPNFATTYRFLAATYAHMGRLEDARAVLKCLHTLTPLVMVRAPMYRNPEHRQLYLDGINLALSTVGD